MSSADSLLQQLHIFQTDESISSYVYTQDIYANNKILYDNEFNSFVTDHFSQFNPIKSKKVDSGLLQPGVKMIGDNYLVFERPPTFKNIFHIPFQKDDIDYEDEKYEPSIYRIPLPWQLYFVGFNPKMYVITVRMFFMQNSLMSIDQDLYLPPLPNFYTSAMLCAPSMSTLNDIDRYSKDHAGVMACAYDWVWNSGTNNDLTEACLSYWTQISKNEGILQNLDEDIYLANFSPTSHFKLSHMRYACSRKQISLFLSNWEKFTLPDVCQMPWPNLAESNAFSSVDSIWRNRFSFCCSNTDMLVSYFEESGEYNSNEIENLINENDMSEDAAYLHWLTGNGYISPPKRLPMTYQVLFPELINNLVRDLRVQSYSLSSTINNIICTQV